MTSQEYKEYEASVAEFFKREGITNLSSMADEEGNSEPFFSWRSCECCGTPLGGDRENANGWSPRDKEIKEYTVCTDCIYYAEYGQLDDMTMMTLDVRPWDFGPSFKKGETSQ